MKYGKCMLTHKRVKILGEAFVGRYFKTKDLNSSYWNIQLTLLMLFLTLSSNAQLALGKTTTKINRKKAHERCIKIEKSKNTSKIFSHKRHENYEKALS